MTLGVSKLGNRHNFITAPPQPGVMLKPYLQKKITHAGKRDQNSHTATVGVIRFSSAPGEINAALDDLPDRMDALRKVYHEWENQIDDYDNVFQEHRQRITLNNRFRNLGLGLIVASVVLAGIAESPLILILPALLGVGVGYLVWDTRQMENNFVAPPKPEAPDTVPLFADGHERRLQMLRGLNVALRHDVRGRATGYLDLGDMLSEENRRIVQTRKARYEFTWLSYTATLLDGNKLQITIIAKAKHKLPYTKTNARGKRKQKSGTSPFKTSELRVSLAVNTNRYRIDATTDIDQPATLQRDSIAGNKIKVVADAKGIDAAGVTEIIKYLATYLAPAVPAS